jgi:hypothetical protein
LQLVRIETCFNFYLQVVVVISLAFYSYLSNSNHTYGMPHPMEIIDDDSFPFHDEDPMEILYDGGRITLDITEEKRLHPFPFCFFYRPEYELRTSSIWHLKDGKGFDANLVIWQVLQDGNQFFLVLIGPFPLVSMRFPICIVLVGQLKLVSVSFLNQYKVNTRLVNKCKSKTNN